MNQTGRYILRVILGGYLTFIGANLIREMLNERPSDMSFKIFMGVLFVVVGAAYAIWSIKTMIGIAKKETEEQQRAEAAQEAERKLEEKKKRDQMKFRTAPMPSPSDIVKGMVTIKEETENVEEVSEEESYAEKADSSAETVSVNIAEQKKPAKRLNEEENTDNTDVEESESEESDFEEV